MKTSLIKRLTEVLTSKTFKNITDEPVGKNEKIMREATDSEKAILTLMCEESEKVDNLVDNRGKNISNGCDGITCGCAIKHHLKNVEVLSQLFWQEIHGTLEKIEDTGLGIRKDFQIVYLPEKDARIGIKMAIISSILGRKGPEALA